MIKPLDEYSPEDRAFVEYCQNIRNQPRKPPHDPGPFNWEEIRPMLEAIDWDTEEEPAFKFGPKVPHAED